MKSQQKKNTNIVVGHVVMGLVLLVFIAITIICIIRMLLANEQLDKLWYLGLAILNTIFSLIAALIFVVSAFIADTTKKRKHPKQNGQKSKKKNTANLNANRTKQISRTAETERLQTEITEKGMPVVEQKEPEEPLPPKRSPVQSPAQSPVQSPVQYQENTDVGTEYHVVISNKNTLQIGTMIPPEFRVDRHTNKSFFLVHETEDGVSLELDVERIPKDGWTGREFNSIQYINRVFDYTLSIGGKMEDYPGECFYLQQQVKKAQLKRLANGDYELIEKGFLLLKKE